MNRKGSVQVKCNILPSEGTAKHSINLSVETTLAISSWDESKRLAVENTAFWGLKHCRCFLSIVNLGTDLGAVDVDMSECKTKFGVSCTRVVSIIPGSNREEAR